MKSYPRIAVRPIGKLVLLGFVFLGIFALIAALMAVFNSGSTPPVVAGLMFTPFMLIPLAMILLGWLFKVDVDGRRVSVRTMFGRKYSFDVSEVKWVFYNILNVKIKVDRGIVEWGQEYWDMLTNGGNHRVMIIKIASGRKLSLDVSMNGFEEMEQYILERVPERRIIVSRSVGEALKARLFSKGRSRKTGVEPKRKSAPEKERFERIGRQTNQRKK
jgi:hypothetical protein